MTDSGDFGSFTDTAAIEAVGAGESVWEAISADKVTAVKTSAGVGKLSSSSASTSSAGTVAKVANVASSETSSSVKASTTAAAATTPAATSKAPAATTSAADPAAPKAEEKASAASESVAARWGRCGGNGWTGATACEEGRACIVVNDCKSP